MNQLPQHHQYGGGTLDIYKHFQHKQHQRETRFDWPANNTHIASIIRFFFFYRMHYQIYNYPNPIRQSLEQVMSQEILKDINQKGKKKYIYIYKS